MVAFPSFPIRPKPDFVCVRKNNTDLFILRPNFSFVQKLFLRTKFEPVSILRITNKKNRKWAFIFANRLKLGCIWCQIASPVNGAIFFLLSQNLGGRQVPGRDLTWSQTR